ncbi:hypothetical protein [Vibrio splendidus]|nr:hypothetical protein [Vibrio splendidus]
MVTFLQAIPFYINIMLLGDITDRTTWLKMKHMLDPISWYKAIA